jgi:hypothetical protein
MMAVQRKGYKQADARHFPDDRRIFRQGKLPGKWVAQSEQQAGKQSGAFMGEIFGH